MKSASSININFTSTLEETTDTVSDSFTTNINTTNMTNMNTDTDAGASHFTPVRTVRKSINGRNASTPEPPDSPSSDRGGSESRSTTPRSSSNSFGTTPGWRTPQPWEHKQARRGAYQNSKIEM